MSDQLAPPGWYPDPGGSGGQRYYDGSAWTAHFSGPVWTYPGAVPGVYTPSWKGARLGLPASGSGALADPSRRLAARVLDGLVLLPVAAIIVGIAVALVAPHAGPMFPVSRADSTEPTPTPGFVWVYLAVGGGLVLSGIVAFLYEAIATGRYERTLGKAWLGIRPVRIDGSPVGWGRSFLRAAIQSIVGAFAYFGVLDDLWCLWDADRQCIHDKVADTIVVND